MANNRTPAQRLDATIKAWEEVRLKMEQLINAARLSVGPSHLSNAKIIAIQAAVSNFYNAPISCMTTSGKKYDQVRPRQIAMYLCAELTRCGRAEIGFHFGGRNHGSVIWAINKVEEDMETDKTIKTDVRTLREMCERRFLDEDLPLLAKAQ